METSEISAAFLVSLLSIALGLLVYTIFFHPGTGKVREKFRGFRKRLFKSFHYKLNSLFQFFRKRFVLILVLAAVIAAVLFAVFRFEEITAFATDFAASALKRVSSPSMEEEVELKPALVEHEAADEMRIVIADHSVINAVRLDRIPESAIRQAKEKLHIVYVYSSHGSQLKEGMRDLVGFKGALYKGLDIDFIYYDNQEKKVDLADWAERAREYLSSHPAVNVVVWSWNGQHKGATQAEIELYLDLMSQLEEEHPAVAFVYMTGHLDGTGLNGNAHLRNEQIREYCRTNGKTLYDFADIESYDPDGNYYGDKNVNDGCWYDSDGNGSLDKNWAKEWEDSNPEGWYICAADHSYPINANLKAYAAWWLWARLAGWTD